MNEMQSSERWIIGALLTVALLTFFFPLATLQVPILGSQDVSGYDLITKAREFNQALDTVRSKELRGLGTEPSQPVPSESNAIVSDSSIPLSVRTLPLIPIEIIASFACALLALFCCLGPFGSAPTKAFSAIGGVGAVAALLHLSVANSDLHTWFREQMKADSPDLANNPFAGLARQIENLAVNSVQLRPGVGLYVLAAALSLAAVVAISRVLSMSRTAEAAIELYPDQSSERARLFAFFALLLVGLTVAVIVLVHKPGTGASTRDAVQPAPLTSQGSDIFRWPTDGLPADIANALGTPDLAPTAPSDGTKALVLGVAGQKQFIPAVNDDDCIGSGGCVWKIKDAATQRELLTDSQGALHKTQKLTNGYYDLLVEDKWGLYLYQFQGERYKNTLCYGRSNGLGSPAKLTSCPTGVEPTSTTNDAVPTPNQSVAMENASAAPPIGVTKGQTSEEVLAILGPPISVTVGAKRVYSYSHLTVVFVDGKVSEIHQF